MAGIVNIYQLMSRICRIKHIQGGVIYRGRRPRWIIASEICLILHILRKPNSLIALLFIQNSSQFKNIAKTCLPTSMLSSCLGLCSSANILQIANVTLRVVFLLFLPCFQFLFRLVPAVFTLETSEMSAIFVSTTKTTQPPPQVFSANTKFFQIWSPVTGYGELCVCFQPIRIGEIF